MVKQYNCGCQEGWNCDDENRVGKNSFDGMKNSAIRTPIKISNESPEDRRGDTKESFNNGKPVSAEVTIYEDSIKRDMEKVQNGAKFVSNDLLVQTKEDMTSVLFKNNDLEAAIGATGTHEGIHAADPQNLKESYENTQGGNNNVEIAPLNAQIEYMRVLYPIKKIEHLSVSPISK